MDNEKNVDFEEDIEIEEERAPSEAPMAPRARNRTVMLTPEITGEVRARIARDLHSERPAPAEQPANGPAQQFFSGMYNAPRASSVDREPPASYNPPPRASHPEPQPQAPAHAGAGRFLAGPQAPAHPARAQAKGDRIVWTKESPIVGFLVSFDKNENGEVFELRVGRLIVTSEASGAGNCLLIQDDSVSPMHAILRINKGGELQVLDQLSEHGTKIHRFGNGEEELSGDKGVLSHGDIVIFGKRKFHVCTLAGADSEA